MFSFRWIESEWQLLKIDFYFALRAGTPMPSTLPSGWEVASWLRQRRLDFWCGHFCVPFLLAADLARSRSLSDGQRIAESCSLCLWRIITSNEKGHWGHGVNDALAERSKAVAQGAIPKGRGFEPHRRHFFGHACPVSARSHHGQWRKHSLHNCFLSSLDSSVGLLTARSGVRASQGARFGGSCHHCSSALCGKVI